MEGVPELAEALAPAIDRVVTQEDTRGMENESGIGDREVTV
jgi:hypothetical protein